MQARDEDEYKDRHGSKRDEPDMDGDYSDRSDRKGEM